jgi:hypothetical protein
VDPGDYQVQVHIIEAMDLAGHDASGLSDPLCYVEVMGDKQHTMVKTQTRSCVWDHLFFFSLHDVDRERLEAGLVKISVFDADKMSRDDLIGTCEFDCLDVYQQVDAKGAVTHQVFEQWVVLVDSSDIGASGVQGYLKLSITVIGPNDPMPVHKTPNPRDVLDERVAIVPPQIKSKVNFLVATIYKAEGLPEMDMNHTCDPYVQVDIGGQTVCRTSIKDCQAGTKWDGDSELCSDHFNCPQGIHPKGYNWYGEEEESYVYSLCIHCVYIVYTS